MESTNPTIIELTKKLTEKRELLCNQNIQRGKELQNFFTQSEAFMNQVIKITNGTNWGDFEPIKLFNFITIRFKACPTVGEQFLVSYYNIIINLEAFANKMKLNHPLFRRYVYIELLFDSNNKNQIQILLSLSDSDQKPIQYMNLSQEYYQPIKLVLTNFFGNKEEWLVQLLKQTLDWYSNQLQ